MSPEGFHGNDHRAAMYEVYLIMDEAAADAVFMGSHWFHQRATLDEADWLPPGQMWLPRAEPGALSTPQQLNAERKSEQLLGGEHVVRTMLSRPVGPQAAKHP